MHRGSGLDASVEGKLFEPFVTTKQRDSGLGLAFCRRVTKENGGDIEAVNHSEGGVEVTCVLPQGNESFRNAFEPHCVESRWCGN